MRLFLNRHLLLSVLLAFWEASAVHAFNVGAARWKPSRLSTTSRIGFLHQGSSRLFSSSSLQEGVSSIQQQTTKHLIFEYCTGCRWMNRASWMAQELLTTFNEENLSAVSLVPSRPPPGARFVVSCCCCGGPKSETSILWDREQQEGFPEIKELKQLVRDKIHPDLYLGHSDSTEKRAAAETKDSSSDNDETNDLETIPLSSSQVLSQVLKEVKGPNVAIQYCTGCRWMLRSAYFATELMTTFKDEINSVTLIPCRPPEKGGVFTVTLDGKVLWDREEKGGFPEAKQLKQIVRDLLVPSKSLGHIDKQKKETDPSDDEDDDVDDEEAEKMRAYYGVQ